MRTGCLLFLGLLFLVDLPDCVMNLNFEGRQIQFGSCLAWNKPKSLGAEAPNEFRVYRFAKNLSRLRRVLSCREVTSLFRKVLFTLTMTLKRKNFGDFKYFHPRECLSRAAILVAVFSSDAFKEGK